MSRPLKIKKDKPIKLNRGEKTLIAITDLNQYGIFKCQMHGIFSIKNTVPFKLCIYCKKSSLDITNEIKDLQELFRREILVN